MSKNRKGKKQNNKQRKKQGTKIKKKLQSLLVPVNSDDNLVDVGLTRSHNFLSSTNCTHTMIYKMKNVGGAKYVVSNKVHSYSTILKLTMRIHQTEELSYDWSVVLWNITQQGKLDPDVKITSVRSFERKNDDIAKTDIRNRRWTTKVSSTNEDSKKRLSKGALHDNRLLQSLERGEGVINFGAELIITAPTEVKLEKAVNDVSDYLRLNEVTKGLAWSLDINKQNYPFIISPPNNNSVNKGQFVEMTTEDASHTALFVDSGGDRERGAEYVGVSVGKLIQSHAAYKFMHKTSLFVGNDAVGKTHTRSKDYNEPSQIYLSKVASRAYLLQNKKVVHFVMDQSKNVKALESMSINKERITKVDASDGCLNMLEAIKPVDFKDVDARVIPFFNTHLNNIIMLVSQFRDVEKVNINDKFSQMMRQVLTDYFIYRDYWRNNPEANLESLRLFGNHEDYGTLGDFIQYVTNQSNKTNSPEYKDALEELNNILRYSILTPLPFLNVITKPIVDNLVTAQYKIVDLTSLSIGAISTGQNSALTTMALAYLNILLPTLSNGDVIMFHGMSSMLDIASLILRTISSSGKVINIVFTESNQQATQQLLEFFIKERTKGLDVKPDNWSIIDDYLDYTIVDLYNNDVDILPNYLGVTRETSKSISENKASYFVQTKSGLDYIYLDDIL